MRTLLISLLLLFASASMAQQTGDSYIESPDGEIVLFALPGCEIRGESGLYGFAKWTARESEIICWQYNRVIYIYAPGRTIIFDPSDVRVRDVNEVRDPAYG